MRSLLLVTEYVEKVLTVVLRNAYKNIGKLYPVCVPRRIAIMQPHTNEIFDVTSREMIMLGSVAGIKNNGLKGSGRKSIFENSMPNNKVNNMTENIRINIFN